MFTSFRHQPTRHSIFHYGPAFPHVTRKRKTRNLSSRQNPKRVFAMDRVTKEQKQEPKKSASTPWDDLKDIFECSVCYQQTPFQIQCERCEKSCCVECVQKIIDASLSIVWSKQCVDTKNPVSATITRSRLTCPNCRFAVEWAMENLLPEISVLWRRLTRVWFLHQPDASKCPFCQRMTSINEMLHMKHVSQCAVRRSIIKCPSCPFVCRIEAREEKEEDWGRDDWNDVQKVLNAHWSSGQCTMSSSCIDCQNDVPIHEWFKHYLQHVESIMAEVDIHWCAVQESLASSQIAYQTLTKEKTRKNVAILVDLSNKVVANTRAWNMFLTRCRENRILEVQDAD